MAKSEFAKYAERVSIGVVALIVLAWVVLTFFMDGSQEPDTVEPGQEGQIDNGVESVPGDEAASDQSDGTTNDAGTDDGTAAGADDAAEDPDGSEADVTVDDQPDQIDQTGRTDGIGEPATDVGPESGDAVSGGVDAEADQPAVSGVEDGVSDDAGTEGGPPPDDGDSAEVADDSKAEVIDAGQPGQTDGIGEPDTGVGPESGDAVSGGVDAEADQPAVSGVEDGVPDDAGTAGADDAAEDPDGSEADVTDDGQPDQIDQTGRTDGIGEPDTDVGPESGDAVSGGVDAEADQPAVSGVEDGVPDEAGTEGGPPPGDGDSAEVADESDGSESDGTIDDLPGRTDGIGKLSTDAGAESSVAVSGGVDAEADQPAAAGVEDGVPDEAGTEGGPPPDDSDSAGGADYSGTAICENDLPDRIHCPDQPSTDVGAESSVAVSGGIDAEADQPAVPGVEDGVPDEAGTEGGPPSDDGDSAEVADESEAEVSDDDQAGRTDGAGKLSTEVGTEPSIAVSGGVDMEAAQPATARVEDGVPDEAGTEGGPPSDDGDSAEVADESEAEVSDDDQADRTDGAGKLSTEVGTEPGDIVSGGVDAEPDQPAVAGVEDGATDDAGTEDGTVPDGGDSAEVADESEAEVSDDDQADRTDGAGKLSTEVGTESSDIASEDDATVDTQVSGQQIAKLDLDLEPPGNTELRREIGTPEHEETVILPTFDVVRVDQFEFATIAGRGMPNWTIDVLINSELKVSDRISRDGQFAFILQLDTEGSPLEIALLSRDSDGIAYRSPETVVIFTPESVVDPKSEEIQLASADTLLPAVLIATPERVILEQPPIPIQPAGSPGENLRIDSISYDMTGEVVLTGRGSAKGFVRVYLDNLLIKTEQITDFGTWEIALPEVDAGRYMLRVEELDQSKNVVASIITPFQKEFREDALEKMKEAAQASGKSGVFDLAEGRIADIVTVQPGYTLWGISHRSFGQGRFFVRIYHTNIDQIDDPNLIFPGQLLVVPNFDTAPPRRPFN